MEMEFQQYSEKCWDAFISYRRNCGAEFARLVKIYLQKRNLNTFLDVDELKSGRFDVNLERNIQDSKNLILVLTPQALDRCIGDDACKDWVHKETVTALQSNCTIIPVIGSGFVWPDEKHLPEDIRDILYCNGIKWNHENPEGVVDKLEEFIREKEKFNEKSKMRPLNDSKIAAVLKQEREQHSRVDQLMKSFTGIRKQELLVDQPSRVGQLMNPSITFIRNHERKQQWGVCHLTKPSVQSPFVKIIELDQSIPKPECDSPPPPLIKGVELSFMHK